VRGDVEQHALGQRTGAGVAACLERVRGQPLDVGEVVVPGPHVGPQLPVGRAGLLRRRHHPLRLAAQLLVQADEVLEDDGRQPGGGPQRRQGERGVERIGLGPLQGQLQRGPLARRLRPEQLLDGHAEPARQRAEQPQRRLPVPVLHLGQVRRRAAGGLGQLGQGQPALLPLVLDPLADHPRVERRSVWLRCDRHPSTSFD
jgi:hypothetical protein